ncbi:MAG: TRAP transporter large permease [Fusobacterium perfoetens]|uniref:TRAP transporter large permease n=1 Tax=Fusobacterium perfoetens TaxID=852 RepID=UPI0023F3C9ED|nr:TRAP transporter large permease [Fusobacterium perfoetens]MCI6153379.1 TRAP transporter large permease [Fusobacterium perfoetens]MDY3238478.1 TRAP transporter large permease [Fusobacterium perfoetens]
MNSFLPIIVLFIFFFLNVPISFALMGASLFFFGFTDTGMDFDLIMQTFIRSAESFPLLAIPFFIMAGSIMNYSGISKRLMGMAEVLTGHLTGGLAHVNILLSVLMGGISGSANADAAMQCKILVPEMVKRGYSKEFSGAITAASSIISPIIPPGIVLIIYALLSNVSVTKMFIAGYVPAIMIALALMIVVAIISKKRNYLPSRDKRASAKEILIELKNSFWALILPFVIILGMRVGIFTPTEAGAIAVVVTTFIGFFVYKELKISDFKIILLDTVSGTSTVMFILIAANVFGAYLSWERLPYQLTEILLEYSNTPGMLLLMINLILLFAGMFIDGGAAMIILAPLLIPAASSLGIDLLHLGIVMVVNIMLGGITPPFGSMMFLTCSLLNIRLQAFIKEVIPFIISLLIILGILTYCPKIVLFLPNLLS